MHVCAPHIYVLGLVSSSSIEVSGLGAIKISITLSKCVFQCVHAHANTVAYYICVCVCERERERERVCCSL